MTRNKKMSYTQYLDKYQQRDKEPKKYYRYMDRYNSNGGKKEKAMAYNNKKNMKKKNSGMIAKDYNAPANLPQSEKHMMYNSPYYKGGDKYDLMDSLKAQDEQISSDMEKMFKGKAGEKYPEKY